MLKLDWLIPGYLAGTVRPVTAVEPGSDLHWLHQQGIRVLVSLTERAPASEAGPEALEILHFPVEDQGIPPAPSTASLCQKVIDAIVGGRPVAITGSTGTRRTALMLACCLVAWRGHAESALEIVQQMGPSYVPTEAQREFVRRFESELPAPCTRRPGVLGSDHEQKGTEAQSGRRLVACRNLRLA